MNIAPKFTALNSLLALALLGGVVPMASAQATTTAPVAAAEMTQAEVRKIDAENKKITLKHGEIKSLDMPPMTMVFSVKEASLLEALKVGDKIQFVAEKINGNYVVTKVAK
jgi:Cu(I)/Ag(I) efflux system periplasmic protein CusF